MHDVTKLTVVRQMWCISETETALRIRSIVRRKPGWLDTRVGAAGPLMGNNWPIAQAWLPQARHFCQIARQQTGFAVAASRSTPKGQ